MNPVRLPTNDERLLDLLVQRAAQGLSADEQRELAQRSACSQAYDELCFDHVTACLDVAWARSEANTAPEMPANVRQRLEHAADAWCSAAASQDSNNGTPLPMSDTSQPNSGRARKLVILAAGGWLIAAAALLLAGIGWAQVYLLAPAESEPREPLSMTTADEREHFLERRQDAVVSRWDPWDDPEVSGVEGDVVWSTQEQAGFLRFEGLPVNDPDEFIYQLWIVDAARGEPLEVPPVDGGTFSVDRQQVRDGEYVVPIYPRLPIEEPVAFAVTIEKPGGAVVSDRSRRVVVSFLDNG